MNVETPSAIFSLARVRSTLKLVDGKRRAQRNEVARSGFSVPLALVPNERSPRKQDELYVVERERGCLVLIAANATRSWPVS